MMKIIAEEVMTEARENNPQDYSVKLLWSDRLAKYLIMIEDEESTIDIFLDRNEMMQLLLQVHSKD